MTTIEINNLYSTVIDSTPRLTIAIDNALAVETPRHEFTATFRSGMWDGMTRFYRKGSNKFPTGLLSDVVTTLRRFGDEPEIIDKRNAFSYKLADEVVLAHKKYGQITLRDYQYESVQKALAASRGIIDVATNGGKTEIACGIIQAILPTLKKDEKLVFFTHAKEIFSQSHERISERLGIKVGKIGDSIWDEQQVTVVMIPTIGKYLKKPKDLPKSKKLKDLTENIEVINVAIQGSVDETQKEHYTTLKADAEKELKEYRKQQWNTINEKVKKTQKFLKNVVGFLADEVHHASSDTWYKLFMSLDCYYRFGLTGTVDEKDPINHKKLLGCTGKTVIEITNDFLIKRGYSARPTIYMMEIPADVINYRYADARTDGIIHNEIRNQIFVKKILERANSGKQCLIIVNEIEHGEIVLDMLEGHGHTVKLSHGKKTNKYREKVLEELRDGSLRILIVNTIFDEGVDVPDINCLFLMAGGKSTKQLLQRIGRGLREKSDGSGLEVYDGLDYHNEYLVDHTFERYSTYKAEGFEIIKLKYEA